MLRSCPDCPFSDIGNHRLLKERLWLSCFPALLSPAQCPQPLHCLSRDMISGAFSALVMSLLAALLSDGTMTPEPSPALQVPSVQNTHTHVALDLEHIRSSLSCRTARARRCLCSDVPGKWVLTWVVMTVTRMGSMDWGWVSGQLCPHLSSWDSQGTCGNARECCGRSRKPAFRTHLLLHQPTTAAGRVVPRTSALFFCVTSQPHSLLKSGGMRNTFHSQVERCTAGKA